VTPALRPPRPSLSSDNLVRRAAKVENNGAVVASDSDASEVVGMDPSFHGHLHLRTEFREGDNLLDYQEKLALFIPQQSCFV